MIRHFCIAAVVAASGILALQPDGATAQMHPAAARTRVAVMEMRQVSADAALASAVTDALRSHLVKQPRIELIERDRVAALLDEQALQQTGITDARLAARIGQLLNAEYVVTGRILALGGAYQVQAQVVSVETARIVRSESIVYRGTALGLLVEAVPALAELLAGAAGITAAPGTDHGAPVMTQASKSTIPLWAAAVAGLGALYLADVATQDYDAAARMADESRRENDAAKYARAKQQVKDGDAKQSAALGLGVAGIALAAYYLFSPEPEPKAAPPRTAQWASSWSVAWEPHTLKAGYATTW